MQPSEYTLCLKPSPALVDFIKSQVEANPDSEDIPKQIAEIVSGEAEKFSAVDFEWVLQKVQAAGLSLKKLGLSMELPEPQQPVRSAELEARCQKLRRDQEDREYRLMTKAVDSTRRTQPEETIAFQLKQINRQLIAVGQFVVSVAAGFAFGFIGLELIVGELEMGFRLLCGTFFAVIIAIAEIYFLLRHLDFSEFVIPEAQSFEKKKDSAKAHQD